MDNIGHVGGEGGQRLLDALLISDVRVDIVKDGQLTVIPGGNVQACLSHERQQAAGLEGDRLAAGVGTGHDQEVVVLSQADINGDDGILVQKGVTSRL